MTLPRKCTHGIRGVRGEIRGSQEFRCISIRMNRKRLCKSNALIGLEGCEESEKKAGTMPN